MKRIVVAAALFSVFCSVLSPVTVSAHGPAASRTSHDQRRLSDLVSKYSKGDKFKMSADSYNGWREWSQFNGKFKCKVLKGFAFCNTIR